MPRRLLILCISCAVVLLAALPGEAAPFAYITNENSDNVSVIDTATNTVVATIPVGNAPDGVAVNAAGTRVYIVNSLSNTVSVIDTATNSVVATVPTGNGPIAVAVNPAGTRATGTRVYVTNQPSNSVSVIDTATNTVVASVAVGSNPDALGLFIGGPASGSSIPTLSAWMLITLMTALAALGLFRAR